MQVFTFRRFVLEKTPDGRFLLYIGQGKPPAEIPASNVSTWEFSLKPYTGLTSLELARRMASSGVFNATGIGDTDAISTVRGMFLAELLIDTWKLPLEGIDADIPPSPENIRAMLPKEVAKAFGTLAEMDGFPTLEEIEAAKNGSGGATPPTSNSQEASRKTSATAS